jgi:hypothetical protein
MEYRTCEGWPQLHFDVGRADYSPPLLGVVDDQLFEIGRRAGKRHAAQFGKPSLDLGIGQARIDVAIKDTDDSARRVLRHADAVPAACLVALQGESASGLPLWAQ